MHWLVPTKGAQGRTNGVEQIAENVDAGIDRRVSECPC